MSLESNTGVARIGKRKGLFLMQKSHFSFPNGTKCKLHFASSLYLLLFSGYRAGSVELKFYLLNLVSSWLHNLEIQGFEAYSAV